MKALSLREPWATVVLAYGKRVENRRRFNQLYPREHFAIHVAVGGTHAEWDRDLAWISARFPDIAAKLPASPDEAKERGWKRGGIAGVARIVGVIRPHGDLQFETSEPFDALAAAANPRWHMAGQWGYVLAEVEPTLEFTTCRGMLGFFDVPDDLVERVSFLREPARAAPKSDVELWLPAVSS